MTQRLRNNRLWEGRPAVDALINDPAVLLADEPTGRSTPPTARTVRLVDGRIGSAE